jgi:hypothetical protein
MAQIQTITVSDVEQAWQTTLNPNLREQLRQADLRYEEITPQERDQYLLEVIEVLIGEGHSAAGQKRLPEWETGWGQNLSEFLQTKNPAALIPKYHGKHRLLHWRQAMIRPLVPKFDYLIHCLLVDWAIETYLGNASTICEFGCGPAYHLLRARRINPSALLIGMDWAKPSQEIIAALQTFGIEKNIRGHRLDFYAPDPALQLPPQSGIMTVAALEQVGDRHEAFIDFLLQQKPSICVHLEPIDELMDPTNLLDRLTVLYCRKRNYLHGYLTRLRELAQAGRIEIIREQRTYSGSFFIEGHSLIVWRPL